MHCRAKDMDAWLLSTITIVSLGLSQMATCNGLSGPMAKAVLQASLWTSLTKMLLLCICYHTVNNVRLIKYAALKQWLWKQYIRWSHLSLSRNNCWLESTIRNWDITCNGLVSAGFYCCCKAFFSLCIYVCFFEWRIFLRGLVLLYLYSASVLLKLAISKCF